MLKAAFVIEKNRYDESRLAEQRGDVFSGIPGRGWRRIFSPGISRR
jgi:hypothetical protein